MTAATSLNDGRMRRAVVVADPLDQGDGEPQHGEQDLDAGLGDPQLLEQLVELAVAGLQLGLAADDLVPLRVVDLRRPLALRALVRARRPTDRP